MTQEEIQKILHKIRNYEIRIRKAVNAHLRGSFASLFKGTGLEFDDVRAYQYGDDVRHIDWNTSAKGDETFIKVFREEKEQTVFFLLDVSESQNIGRQSQRKIDLGREICSVLALSAVKEGSEVGLICFSDRKEKYIKPDKGMKKAYEIMVGVFKLVPESLRTNLTDFIHFSLNLIKKRSIVILISDFIDEDYEQALKSLARKHDLIVLHLIDEQERKLPQLGIIPVYDKESQQTYWINTSSKKFQRNIRQRFTQNQENLQHLCRKYRANYLPILTQDDFVPSLVRLFKIRNRKIRGV